MSMKEQLKDDVVVHMKAGNKVALITDAKGVNHRLADMTSAHLANVLKFTRGRADRLYALDRGEDPNEHRVDDAGFTTEGFVSNAEALGWLESTPLIQAIKARLAGSGTPVGAAW